MLRIPLRAACPRRALPPRATCDCVDNHNQCLEWGWKGECERNAPLHGQELPPDLFAVQPQFYNHGGRAGRDSVN